MGYESLDIHVAQFKGWIRERVRFCKRCNDAPAMV